MNMVSDEVKIQPVVINSDSLPEKPKVRFWHWINYYFYNLARKPKVWAKQRELKELADSVQRALENSLYPILIENLRRCEMCADAYAALRPQIFLSQIELILKRMKCSSHSRPFENFLSVFEKKFRDSERISRWINGFE